MRLEIRALANVWLRIGVSVLLLLAMDAERKHGARPVRGVAPQRVVDGAEPEQAPARESGDPSADWDDWSGVPPAGRRREAPARQDGITLAGRAAGRVATPRRLPNPPETTIASGRARRAWIQSYLC
jgi:hypothetical protein